MIGTASWLAGAGRPGSGIVVSSRSAKPPAAAWSRSIRL